MKNLFLFIVVLLAHKLNAQTNNKDKQAVLEKVSTFFKALEKKIQCCIKVSHSPIARSGFQEIKPIRYKQQCDISVMILHICLQ